jgi:hypothetical protein
MRLDSNRSWTALRGLASALIAGVALLLLGATAPVAMAGAPSACMQSVGGVSLGFTNAAGQVVQSGTHAKDIQINYSIRNRGGNTLYNVRIYMVASLASTASGHKIPGKLVLLSALRSPLKPNQEYNGTTYVYPAAGFDQYQIRLTARVNDLTAYGDVSSKTISLVDK